LLQICTHSDFELIALLMIFGNCISLAAYDPVHHDGPRNKTLEKIGGCNCCISLLRMRLQCHTSHWPHDMALEMVHHAAAVTLQAAMVMLL
jgi:hypothetical protein